MLDGVPNLRDVDAMIRVLTSVGAHVFREHQSLVVEAAHLDAQVHDRAAVESFRAGFLVLGPLLARLGSAHVPLPGGCTIGARPVDLHLSGLQQMGAEITVEEGAVRATGRRHPVDRSPQPAETHPSCPSSQASCVGRTSASPSRAWAPPRPC